MEFYGAHGTKHENRTSIIEHGFQSAFGRLGKGVYFWKEGKYALLLAKAHVRAQPGFEVGKGLVFCCTIQIENEDDVFDGEDEDLKLRVVEWLEKSGLNTTDKRNISLAWDYMLTQYEILRERPILVLVGRVAHPPSKGFVAGESYPVYVLGAPFCYVVRKNDIIQIREEIVF